MKYLITKKAKKLTKDYNNSTFEITIPKNQMIEVAYKTSAGEGRKEQIIGAFVYLKMGDEVYPSIVEFSSEEVELIGDTVKKEELFQEASLKGRMFFYNDEICTCWEFIRLINYLPFDSFTTVKDTENVLKVSFGYKNTLKGKQVLTVVF